MEAGFSAVKLVSHVYWHRKERFALDRDLYPYWTLFAVQEGRFAYTIRGSEGEAAFGDLVVCPPDTWFHRRVLDPLSFHFFHFSLHTGSLESEDGNSGEGPLPFGKITLSDTSRLTSDYRYLQRLARERNAGFRLYQQHLLTDLFAAFQMERSLRSEETDRADTDPDMYMARQFMLEHACGRIDLGELAHSLRLTPVQLTRRFRTAYGMTPSGFVTEQRLARACRLLAETELTIDRIAQSCGYENGFYLSRIFRQKRGMTPSHYRKAHRV
ncbi:AraC family transcriptional regulator [Paenibacillus humicola]|uniref:AraC family transcriptional regulator n=1 Tax=Paenibacillus humicola TaxID=3110540 RepID=UPI00237B541D|nr:AraC family transcriptional regulator [Paenibacillus humicola]